MTKDEAQRRRWTFYEAVKDKMPKVPEVSKGDALVNVHDTEILSPPRMKIGTLCQAKGAAVMRSNFL